MLGFTDGGEPVQPAHFRGPVGFRSWRLERLAPPWSFDRAMVVLKREGSPGFAV